MAMPGVRALGGLDLPPELPPGKTSLETPLLDQDRKQATFVYLL